MKKINISQKSLSPEVGLALNRKRTGRKSGMCKSIFTLLLFLFALGVGNAWATKVDGSYTFGNSSVTGWTCTPQNTYCGLYYSGGKNSNFVVYNNNIANISGVDFSKVTSPSITIRVKGLTNGGTNSFTVSLVNSSGTALVTSSAQSNQLANTSSSSSASWSNNIVLTPVTGVTGYKITCNSKTALAGTDYSLTYTTASCTAPTITSQPTGNTYTVGATPSALSVTATGTSLTYQWYSNTSNSTSGASSIGGATSSTYSPSTAASGTKYYYCIVSSSTCTTTSNIVAVTVNLPTYTVNWKANGTPWTGSSHGTPTTNVTSGNKVTTLPTAPTSSACDGTKVFVGWTATQNYSNATTPPTDLFITAAGAPAVTGNVTYYAVFATDATEATRITATSGMVSGNYYVFVNDQKTNGTRLFKKDLTVGTTVPSESSSKITTISDCWLITGDNSSNGFTIASSSNKTLGATGTISGTSVTISNTASNSKWIFATSATNYLRIYNKAATGYNVEYSGSNWVAYNSSAENYVKMKVYKLNYSNYETTCCTPLGSIIGSVTWSSPTTAVISWPKNANVTAWAMTCKQGNTNKGSIGALDATGTNNQITISNLTAGQSYDITLSATTTTGNICTGLCDFTPSSITAPKITLSSLSGDDMTYAEGHGPSNAKTFTVSGVGLTGDLEVTAPTNFEVSLDNTNWASSKTITASGTLSATTVYVRLAAEKTYSADPYADNVTVSGGSAADQTMAVSATVTVSCHTPSVTDPTGATYYLNATPTALSVTASKGAEEDPDLTYQWYSNTANSKTTPTPTLISDATSSSYTPLTSAVGTKYYFCVVNSDACEASSGIAAVAVRTPSITVSTTSIAFGDKKKGGSYTETFTVNGVDLANGAGLSLNVPDGMFTIDKTTLPATSNAVGVTTITVTYAPTTAAAHNATLTITSTGATSKTIALSGTGREERTITFNDNGSTTTEKWLDGSQHATPSIDACKSKYGVLGWTTTAPTSNAWSTQPSYTTAGNNITVNGDATYYAVYTEEGETPTNNYRKITSASELISGRKYVITNTSDNKALSCATYYSDYSFSTNTVSPSTGVISNMTTSASIFTITGNNAEGYSIHSAYNNGRCIGYYYDEDLEKDTLTYYADAWQDWKITVNDGGNTYIQPKEALWDYLYYESSYYWLKTTATANHLYRQVYNTTYLANPDCRTLSSIAVKTAPKTTYCETDWLDMSDLVITATYTDESTKDIDYASNIGDFTFTPTASTDLISSHTSVTINYLGKETSQAITVNPLYNITLTSGGELANGTIEADLSSACAGETVTLTATPNTHFTFSSWSVTKTGEPGTTVTVTDNQFTMPAYAVTVNAVFAEAPFRTVVFKNSNAALFDDGDDAELYDATNKWKQKVYVGETPAWPTALTSSEKIDANSNIFYGWTATAWEGKVASKSTIDAKTGAEKVYTDDFTGATVAAGEDEVVYYAVWSKETEGNNFELVTDGSKLKAGDAYLGSYINYSGTRYYGATSNSAMQNITVSGTPKTLSSTTGLKKVTFVATSTSGQFQIKDGTKYLYANGTGSAPSWSDNACAWVFSDKNDNHLFKVKSSLGTYYLRAYATSTTAGALKMYGDQTNNGICVFQKGTSYGDFITTCHTISGASTSGTAVEYDGDDATITSSHNQAYQGTQITLTVPTASHYTFSSWIVKDESNNDVTVTSNKFTMPASDVTVTATWTPKPYSLTVSEPTNGSIAFEGANEQYTAQNVNYHATVTLTATPADEDHYFAGWTISPSIDGVLTTSPELSFSMPGVATTISASFAAVVYPSLTLDDDALSAKSTLSATLANGTAIADMSRIKAGTELKVTYTPDGQKEITGWTLTKEGGGDVEYVEDGNTITFNMPNANLTVAANGEQNYYTLDLSATNGSISVVEINNVEQADASSYRVYEGDDVEVTAVPTDNTYKFKEWQKTNIDASDWGSDGAYAHFTVGTSNMTLSAIFEPKVMYNVTLKAMDKTQEVIANKLEGTSIWSIVRYKTAPNLTDYAFQGWCTDVNNASTTMITELADAPLGTNITLHAVYSKKAVYRKVTSDEGLGDGYYLIVNETYEHALNGGLETFDASGNKIDVEISDDYTIVSNETTDAANFYIASITGGRSIRSAQGDYMGNDNASKTIQQDEDELVNTIEISSGNATIKGAGNYVLRYNTDGPRFRYYSSSSTGENIQLYKKEVAGAATAAPTETVADGETLEITSNKTLGNLVVENGGTVSVASGKSLTVNDFTIEGTQGNSGQVINAQNLTINGEAYFDFTLAVSGETAANQWHNFSVPFPVDVMNGVYNAETGEKLTNEVDYAIEDYHEELRADGKYGWKKYRGVMQPGIAYSMTVNGDIQTFRFKKASGSYVFGSNPTVDYTRHTGAGANTDHGWNGLGNMRMCYATISTSYLVQVLDAISYTYKTATVNKTNFTVGSAFFIQAADNGTMSFSTTLNSGDGTKAFAPARTPAKRIEPIEVNISHETGSDAMFISADEDAKNEYTIGRDLVKMFASNTPSSPLIYGVNYGNVKLSAEEAPLVNGEATYEIRFFVPVAGTYEISCQPSDISNQTELYLTYEGNIIWDLTMSPYEVDLAKGRTDGYGLLMQAKAPSVATGTENIQGDKVQCTKVIIEDHVYILRGGQMYDVTGKAVK